jgi:hypothetical protein
MTLEKLLELILTNPGGTSLLAIILLVFTWNAVTTYQLACNAVTKKDLDLAMVKLQRDLNDSMECKYVTGKECAARHATENA